MIEEYGMRVIDITSERLDEGLLQTNEPSSKNELFESPDFNRGRVFVFT